MTAAALPRTLGLLLACLLVASGGAAAQSIHRESAVKAAFLYNFVSFVEWPADPMARSSDPLVIAVMGQDAVAADLEEIVAGRTVAGRPVGVRRLRENEAANGVHVLFIGAGKEARTRSAITAAAGPVLVVTEQENGLRLGAVLNFVTEGGRVRFTASLPAAEARGLRLSARLLAVARFVEGRAR